MSPDDRAPLEALPEEGLIHEWLDGQLDDVAAARLEALVHTSPTFAAQVAEARGLLAASTRILQALDDVPAGVIPVATPATATAAAAEATDVTAANAMALAAAPTLSLDATRSATGASARRSSAAPSGARRWAPLAGLAAVLLVAAIGVFRPRNEPSDLRGATAVLASPMSMDSATDAPAAPMAVALSDAAPEVVSRSATAPMGTARVAAPAAARSATAPEEITRATADVASGERRDITAPASAGRAGAPVEPAGTERSAAEQRIVTAEQRVIAERALAPTAHSLDARAMAEQAAARAPAARAPAAGAPAAGAPAAFAPAAPLAVADASAPSLPAELPTSIPDAELALSVQRVTCTPDCVQERLDLAVDGRVERIQRPLAGGTASVARETGRVSIAVRDRLLQLADSLGIAALPTTIRLDGARCRTAGQLRESLRVRVRQRDTLHQVVALPWCSDGTHPLDRFDEAARAQTRRALDRP
jgi:hypothetical protein